MTSRPRIALIHDRLNVRGGAERVLEELAGMYPAAPIYTLIYKPELFASTPIGRHEVRSSIIGKFPGAADHHRIYTPIMPLIIDRLRLHEFDVLISSSAAFAHGVRTRPDQLHVSYIHSPMRYAWHQYRDHVAHPGYGSIFIKMLLAYLRTWDRKAAQRADYLVANSQWTANKVKEAFHRESTIIHPPVHVKKFQPASSRGDYYLTVCRFVPYKRVDLIVKAFNKLALPIVIVGDGPERKQIQKLAGPSVKILPFRTEEQLIKVMSEAKAFVYAAEEDFGIAAVEAQAAGCPVIAFGRGGLTESVMEGVTGLLFTDQKEEAIVETVEQFERVKGKFSVDAITKNAERFNAEHFVAKFSAFMDEKIDQKSRSGRV